VPRSAAPAIPFTPFDRASRRALLEPALDQRILVLDGAMGTEIQALRLDEAAFRGERFAAWAQDLRGDNDLLTLTRPAAIAAIHQAYLAAGADIISTNTFNATRVAQSDYGLGDVAAELNLAAARLARAAADLAERADGRPRWVAGALRTNEPHRLHLAEGRGRRLPQHQLRRAGRRVHRGRRRAARRGSGPAPHRDGSSTP